MKIYLKKKTCRFGGGCVCGGGGGVGMIAPKSIDIKKLSEMKANNKQTIFVFIRLILMTEYVFLFEKIPL